MNSQRTSWVAPLLLTVLAFRFSVMLDGLLLLVPLALLLVALPPRKPVHMAIGLFLLIAGLTWPITTSVAWLSRGWALMLGAWFVSIVALRPEGGFINRGLAALCGAGCSAGVLIALDKAAWQEADQRMVQFVRDRMDLIIERLQPELVSREGGQAAFDAMTRSADVLSQFYPGFLALGSLCGMAVAWWLWRRVVVKDPMPLHPLRDFRFRDELIWLVVLAVALLVLPLRESTSRAGANLAFVMVGLYTLRGLGIMITLFRNNRGGAPKRLLEILLIASVIILFPFVAPPLVTTAVVLGIGDTWLDLRARVRPWPSSN